MTGSPKEDPYFGQICQLACISIDAASARNQDFIV